MVIRKMQISSKNNILFLKLNCMFAVNSDEMDNKKEDIYLYYYK
jgi:hypothetical protein